jgi:NADH-ubiquinone oxidoreductase chain 4
MLNSLIFIPLIGIFLISTNYLKKSIDVKTIGLITALINFYLSLFLFILTDYSSIEYQFVQEISNNNALELYLGVDGISIYFILLITFITPIVILSN